MENDWNSNCTTLCVYDLKIRLQKLCPYFLLVYRGMACGKVKIGIFEERFQLGSVTMIQIDP